MRCTEGVILTYLCLSQQSKLGIHLEATACQTLVKALPRWKIGVLFILMQRLSHGEMEIGMVIGGGNT